MSALGKALKNNHLLKPLIGFGMVMDLVILDQISKWIVLEYFFKPEMNNETMDKTLDIFDWIASTVRLPFAQIEITSFFNLTMVWNQGISFGLFQSGSPWPLIIIATIISVVFSVWLCRTKSWVEAICLSMVIGGAIGNIIDRLHFSAVADFLDFHAFGWHYPAFNLADSFITVGIVILVMNSLFFDRDNEKAK